MIVTGASRRRGDELHRRYRPRPGSGFVASGFALGGLDALLRTRPPAAVLEIGAGIGAVTARIAETVDELGLDVVHVAVEDEPFCLEQLEINLGDRLSPIQVVPRVRDLPPGGPPFDLVVIDGGAQEDRAPADQDRWTATDERAEVAAWLPRLAPRAVVFVENRRDRQRSFVEADSRRPFVHEHVRPLDGGPGYHLYWFEPTLAVRATVTARNLARRAWFPRGAHLERQVYLRLHGRPRPPRDTIAPGSEG